MDIESRSPVTDNSRSAWSLPRGRILRRALSADPNREYLVYAPASASDQAPVFVAVHGYSRNFQAQARTVSGFCEQYGAVLVSPIFDEPHFTDYQRLGRQGRGERADLFLNRCVSEVSSLTGADGTHIYLYGFSGGAQFAHRYVMAHPHRVARAVVVASGWYTFPDTRIKYPYGIRISRKLPDVNFNPEEFLRVPVTVLVGEHDVGHSALRSNPKIDEQQGANRVQRARKWVATMRAAAEAYGMKSLVSYTEIPDTDHSFTTFCQRGALPERVFYTLFNAPGNAAADSEASPNAPAARGAAHLTYS